MKPALLGAAIVAALGGLLFGFETAVISGANVWLEQGFAHDAAQWAQTLFASVEQAKLADIMNGFIVASALIGTIVGSLAVGKPADAFGRRGILFVLAVLFFLSAIGCALAKNWVVFVLFRFLGGLAVGGASVVSPMYIAEISPARLRGRLVAVTQLNIVMGILLAYLSNYVIGKLDLGANECPWMFGVMAFPAAAFFFLLLFTPQSPRWLIARGRNEEARTVLERCGADTASVGDEIRDIQASLDLDHHSLAEPFYCRKYLKPILLAVAIAMFNQLSGINAVIYYTKKIFEMAGFDKENALLQSVAIGLANLVFTVAALAVIDHFGRKRLMLVGSIGYIISLTAVTYAFYTDTRGILVLVCLVAFVGSHAFGQGAVIWVFISEIFPNRVRARGQALGSFTHWIMAAAISWPFPLIANLSAWMPFAFFAACCVAQLVWVLTVMPETKGISLENIQKELGIE